MKSSATPLQKLVKDKSHPSASFHESEKEKDILLTLSNVITSCRTKEEIEHLVNNALAEYFHFTEVMICLNNSDNLTHNCYIHFVTQETKSHPDFERGISMKFFINDGIFNAIEESEAPLIFDMEELVSRRSKPFYIDFWHQNKIKELIGFSLCPGNERIGTITLYARVKNTFTATQLKFVQAISSYIGIALANILAYERVQQQLDEIRHYKSRLEEENHYLHEQIKTAHNHSEVIGSGSGLQKIFQLVANVATSDSTVLIQGETGTGKELIARAIHDSSRRSEKLMVKVNCAALPAQLIESELFGHEKGSFTGATDRRIGKFELAADSTLFLDEIGEMAPELQVKLLRAIQEKEIERVGGKGIIKTDVRIIVATNRNLQQEVEAGRFRSDLFYRLNVFPITLPPLRERKEDIPILVSHFLGKLAPKSGREGVHVSPKAIHDMTLYDWPGNVRELEHVIERSLLMTTGNTINEIQLPQTERRSLISPEGTMIKSLEQNEREYILSVLKRCKGRVRGAGGAAELLQIPPTTLHSKMKKLGIKKTIS